MDESIFKNSQEQAYTGAKSSYSLELLNHKYHLKGEWTNWHFIRLLFLYEIQVTAQGCQNPNTDVVYFVSRMNICRW